MVTNAAVKAAVCYAAEGLDSLRLTNLIVLFLIFRLNHCESWKTCEFNAVWCSTLKTCGLNMQNAGPNVVRHSSSVAAKRAVESAKDSRSSTCNLYYISIHNPT